MLELEQFKQGGESLCLSLRITWEKPSRALRADPIFTTHELHPWRRILQMAREERCAKIDRLPSALTLEQPDPAAEHLIQQLQQRQIPGGQG